MLVLCVAWSLTFTQPNSAHSEAFWISSCKPSLLMVIWYIVHLEIIIFSKICEYDVNVKEDVFVMVNSGVAAESFLIEEVAYQPASCFQQQSEHPTADLWLLIDTLTSWICSTVATRQLTARFEIKYKIQSGPLKAWCVCGCLLSQPRGEQTVKNCSLLQRFSAAGCPWMAVWGRDLRSHTVCNLQQTAPTFTSAHRIRPVYKFTPTHRKKSNSALLPSWDFLRRHTDNY